MELYTCHPSHGKKHKIGGSRFKPAWAIAKPYLEITRVKRTGGMAQVVVSDLLVRNPGFKLQQYQNK
jgi:hypothetical protein